MKRFSILFFTVFLFASFSDAQIPDRPSPPKLVNDFANVLSAPEKNQLENTLVSFSNETSTQIMVVTVPDLQGYDKADFAFQVGEKWGVGKKDKNNGIVVLVKPKTNDVKGQVFVATGYGLEGVLPDAVVNSAVVDNEMIPYFEQNQYYAGLASGTKVMMDIARGEYTADEYRQSVSQGGGSIVFVIFLVLFFITLFGRNRRNRFYSPGKSLPFWLALGMMSGGGRGGGGSFGNFSSGGGGFGGFGGGSFGGGGAGGSW